MIILVNNESDYISQIRSVLKKLEFPFTVFNHDEEIGPDYLDKCTGLILSGGPLNPFETQNMTLNHFMVTKKDIPILGICLGHLILGKAFGSELHEVPEKPINMREKIIILKDDPIFSDIGKEYFCMYENHKHELVNLPQEFVLLGESNSCSIEVIKHKSKPIYGFQGHPEMAGRTGEMILKNFTKLCRRDQGADKNPNLSFFLDQ